MGIHNIMKRLFFPESYNGNAYIKTLKNKYHIDIGAECRIWEPNHTYIDIQRPHMLHIGNHVKITRGVTILAHDFSRSVFTGAGFENVGEGRKTWIGDNVFIGMNAIILMGAKIGNNSIVGAGAIVSGEFADGVVIAGNPAMVICSLEDYYKKMKAQENDAAILYAQQWKSINGRWPSVDEMTDAFAWLYLPRCVESVNKHPLLFKPGGVDRDKYITEFLNTTPEYKCFDNFLDDCRKSLEKK